jgi:hypothetical protein
MEFTSRIILFDVELTIKTGKCLSSMDSEMLYELAKTRILPLVFGCRNEWLRICVQVDTRIRLRRNKTRNANFYECMSL